MENLERERERERESNVLRRNEWKHTGQFCSFEVINSIDNSFKIFSNDSKVS